MRTTVLTGLLVALAVSAAAGARRPAPRETDPVPPWVATAAAPGPWFYAAEFTPAWFTGEPEGILFVDSHEAFDYIAVRSGEATRFEFVRREYGYYGYAVLLLAGSPVAVSVPFWVPPLSEEGEP